VSGSTSRPRSRAECEIVEVEAFEQLVALQGFTERIFGMGQRAPGWFRRKLIREGVEARLSAVAIDPDSREPCGCVLVGGAASLGARARGSTVAVAAPVRGRGVGRALIDFADARARACGFGQLEFLCEGERLGWYLHQGFALVERQLLLSASGLGPRDDLPTNVEIEAAPFGADPLWSWLPETWGRTPKSERAYLELDAPTGGVARIWLTREGRAWLALRLELDFLATDLMHVVAQLRRRVAAGTTVLLYPCTAGTPTAEALMSAGFVTLQRSFVVRRPTGE
jgi:GNAT superfamily N-acetyltransferase